MQKYHRLLMLCCFLTLGTFVQFSVLSVLAPVSVEAAKKKKKKQRKAKRAADNYTHSELLAYCKKRYTHAAFIKVKKRNGKWICELWE